VKVRYGEGLAIHTGPEPCVGAREGGGEASAGEPTGQPFRPRKQESPGVPTWSNSRKAQNSIRPADLTALAPRSALVCQVPQ
jgi:RNA-directed DNA polymerase